MVNQRKQGNDYEKHAADFLKEKGFEIIEMNFYCKMGEVDIIARDGSYLVFVEVKYRKNAKSGHAISAVNFNKMRKISRVCDYYLYKYKFPSDTSIRFDVVAIEEGHLQHYKNAFEYIPC
ncbi:MAG: YraN family protein [Pseudobutyrivibrio sp.]|nr:YraN family protein [Pseudobutyrivibrio sp.]